MEARTFEGAKLIMGEDNFEMKTMIPPMRSPMLMIIQGNIKPVEFLLAPKMSSKAAIQMVNEAIKTKKIRLDR